MPRKYSLDFSDWPMIARMYLLYFGFTIVNCLLTSNPYSAVRGGSLGLQEESYVEQFTVHPAYLLILSASPFVLPKLLKFRPPTSAIVAALAFLLSGMVTNIIVERPKTYLFDCIILLICSLVARHDALHPKTNSKCIEYWGFLMLLIQLAGIFISLRFPYTYGNIPLGMSRDDRGEIVLWSLTALSTLLPAFAAWKFHEFSGKSWFFFLGGILIITHHVLGYNRAHTVKMLLSLLALFFFCLPKPGRKYFALLTALCLYPLWNLFIYYFSLGESTQSVMAGIESDRWNLWMHFIDSFRENPFFGIGAFSIERGNYVGKATSEVGMLKWFGEGGIFYGGAMLFILLQGVFAAFMILWNRSRLRTGLDYICGYIALTTFPLALITWYSRIMMIDDFIFFYALFYCSETYFKEKKYLMFAEKSIERKKISGAVVNIRTSPV